MTNNSVIATAPSTGDVTGVAITPDDGRMYATDGDGQVLVFDTATNVPLTSIATGVAGEHRAIPAPKDKWAMDTTRAGMSMPLRESLFKQIEEFVARERKKPRKIVN